MADIAKIDGFEIPAAAGPSIATGTYTGNAGDNRQITVGFKCSFVVVNRSSRTFICIRTASSVALAATPSIVQESTDLKLHGTDGFEVDNNYANESGFVYYYWAISE